MIPDRSLQISEIGIDGRTITLSLERLQNAPVTVGRARDSENHYQIGKGSPSRSYISSYQATIYAKENPASPRGWDYMVKNGAFVDGAWKESQQGIWEGKKLVSEAQLRPGLGGYVTIFPKINNEEVSTNYHCIIEWPAKLEDGDDTHPTVQDLHEAKHEARVFAVEAESLRAELTTAKSQLTDVAQSMGHMQLQFSQEKQQYDERFTRQNRALCAVKTTLEEQRLINKAQDAKIAKIRTLGGIGIAAVLFSLGIEIDQLEKILNLVAVASFGGALLTGADKTRSEQ